MQSKARGLSCTKLSLASTQKCSEWVLLSEIPEDCCSLGATKTVPELFESTLKAITLDGAGPISLGGSCMHDVKSRRLTARRLFNEGVFAFLEGRGRLE
jgi:hypothetical protein